MTESTFRYTTPTAFRTTLKERFRHIAHIDRQYRLDELQRQFAYDRALARLFTSPEADHWVHKGAGALLARLTAAHHSKDLDVFLGVGVDAERAVNALRTALELNLGDHMRLPQRTVQNLASRCETGRGPGPCSCRLRTFGAGPFRSCGSRR